MKYVPLHKQIYMVRIQVLTVTSMKMAVLRDVALRSLVDIERRFRGTCLHHQSDRPEDGSSKLL
jgi:hypothetical protein